MIERAKAFAQQAHEFQVRKYTGEPYWFHCRDVAFLVECVGGTDEMIAAAWLHDTVEDTLSTLADIQQSFGDEVAILVEMLTDVSKPEDGNRAARKGIDWRHTKAANSSAKTIKLADLISNSSSIVRYDKDFARVYVKEKKALLDVLVDGDRTLYHLADEMVIRHLGSLHEA